MVNYKLLWQAEGESIKNAYNSLVHYKLAIKFRFLYGISNYFVYLYGQVRESWSVENAVF
jgi:hypothetical protein